MIIISNSKFDVKGADKKAGVYGLELHGSENVLIENCIFENMGYSSILNESTGDVKVAGCEFICKDVYNPIEGSQKVDNGNVEVADCKFIGAPGNNYINFYQFAPKSEHKIVGCSFEPSVDNNIIRISNRTSAPASFLVQNCAYNFAEGEPTDYTNFLLCQDYTSKSGVKQDFTHCEVVLDNVKCNGIALEDGVAPAVGGVFYVYEDGKGIISGLENDPVVVIK